MSDDIEEVFGHDLRAGDLITEISGDVLKVILIGTEDLVWCRKCTPVVGGWIPTLKHTAIHKSEQVLRMPPAADRSPNT